MLKKPQKTHLRKCIGCGEMKEKKLLVRIVKAPENSPSPGEITLDRIGKKPGRGAYICADPGCLQKAKKSRRLEKAFSCKVPEEVYDQLSALLSQMAGSSSGNEG